MAAVIVAAVAAVIAGVLIGVGMKQLQAVTLTMPKTVATLKEDMQWAKPSVR
jgi:hypothetical protein